MPAANIFYFMGGVVRDGKGLALCHTAPWTQLAMLLAFPSISSVLMENLLFAGLLTSTLLRSVSCKDHLIISWVVEVREVPCMQYSSSRSLLLLSSSDFLPTGICSGSRQLPPLTTAPGGDCSQKQDMLIVELSMDLSWNNVLGGHRRLQKLLLLAGVGCLP